MPNSHDSLVAITKEDVQYILEEHFDEQWHGATYDLLCKNCGKKSPMTATFQLFVNAKGNIMINGTCPNCNKSLRSQIMTEQRIDWNEYAMVVRESRVFFAAYTSGNHQSDSPTNIPTFDKYQNKEFIEHFSVATL